MKKDEQLQRDVLEELAFDPSVEAAAIGVQADDGVVTLTGNVSSFSERWAAEKAVKRVAGVLALANELQVKLPSAAKRDDTDIAKAALSAIRWHVSVPDAQLKVTVKDAWITLEGEVDWAYQRKAADNAVRHLTGVRGVTNLIVVAARVRPEDVRGKIEAALRRSADLEAKQINVEAHDGKVTLRGTVQSWAEREAVERAAWSASGVTAVDDQLTLRTPAYI
jgi:osmotically-inducible protein OsmY